MKWQSCMSIMVQFNMPSCPALPLPPTKKKAVFWCVAHPVGNWSLKFWDSVRKIWLVSHGWADTIFYSVYLEWSREKIFIKTSLIIPKLCLFSWAFWIFLLPSSFYQLNGSLAKSTHSHHFLSLRLFAWKETAPIFVAGIGQLAVPGETAGRTMSWVDFSDFLDCESSREGWMQVNTGERNNSLKKKTTLFSGVHFSSVCTLF